MLKDIDKQVYLFADFSGQIKDDKPLVFTIVLYFNSQSYELKGRFDFLKSKANKMGVDVDDPDFEFHAIDIFHKNKFWYGLTYDQIEIIADGLRKSITTPQVHYLVLAVDKNNNGELAINQFHKFLVSQRKKALDGIDQSLIDVANDGLIKLVGNSGFGLMGDLISSLFGLATAYIDVLGFKGQGKTIVDNEYFPAKKAWPIIFNISKMIFPIINETPNIPFTNKNKHLKWHLGETVSEESSTKYFGIQLADFIAYTTSHVIQNSNNLTSKYSLLNNSELHQFFDYKGIYYATSYPKYFSRKHLNFNNQKSANNYIFRKT